MCACLHTLQRTWLCRRWGEKSVRGWRVEEKGGGLVINQKQSFGCCACVTCDSVECWRRKNWFPYFQVLVSMQTQTTLGLHEGTLCSGVCRWEWACNSSQQQTLCWLHCICTHPHLLCGCCIVVRFCPWWYYLRNTTPVPTVHWCGTTSSKGEIFHAAAQGPRLYWTHMLMEQTQGWEKDPQSHATWLCTTFTSTQHFLQELWDQASKQR